MAEQTEKQKVSKSPLYGYRKPTFDGHNTWCNCAHPTLVRPGRDDRQAYCIRCEQYWYN